MPSDPPMSPHEEFLMWIGTCITAWAKVEEFLFEICDRSLATSRERAAIVYFRTPTLDARISLVNELVLTVLPKRERKSGGHDHPHVETWNDLRLDMIALLKIRNRIAHHPVQAHEVNILTSANILDTPDLLATTWLEIYASDGERLRGRSEDASPLTVQDLIRHGRSVFEIRQRLHKFISTALPKHAE